MGGSLVIVDDNRKPNETNKRNKHMTAKQLITKLNKICSENAVNPADVEVNFRWSNDSDVFRIKSAEEDLFDAETNSILTSITLSHKK